MSAKHTPGPWEVNRWNWPMEMSGRFHRVLNHERFPTAFIPAWSEPAPGEVDGSEEAQANARLIAAAPDLLAALNEVNNWLVCAAIASPEDMAQSFPHMQAVADAAIAKATNPD